MRWLTHDPAEMLEHTTGHVPVILTAAHSGVEPIASLGGFRADPNDSEPFSNYTNDTRTREVAEAVLERLDFSGLRPWAILPRVSRRDLDLNRSWSHNEEGLKIGGVPIAGRVAAKVVYDGYYSRLQTAIADIRNAFDAHWSSRAFLFDIHGVTLSDVLDVEIGTREGASADPALVYGGASTPALTSHLAAAGFHLTASPSPVTEALRGLTVLEFAGLRSGGVNAVQLELSKVRRGDAASGTRAKREVAFGTGQQLARALSTFLRAHGYPSLAPPAIPISDDDCYAALRLC